MEQAQLREHVAVPIGRRPDEAREAPDPVGEAARLRVDEPCGQIVPRGVLRERWVGEAGAQPVVEPPVEFGEPREHPLDPLVTRPIAIRLWRLMRGVTGLRFRLGVRLLSRHRRVSGRLRSGEPGSGARVRRSAGVGRLARRDPSGDPRLDRRGSVGGGDLPVDPQQQQRQRVLAGVAPARAGARRPNTDVVDHRAVGLGATPPAHAPHHPLVGAE